MSWTKEIIRALLLALGSMEAITNGMYLLRVNGMALARNQHRELPAAATERQMKSKVAFMFSFGILMLAASLYSYWSHAYSFKLYTAVLGLFAAYAIIEALYYRYWKTTGFAAAALLLLGYHLFG